jgi:putative SOS response-associated peptidase YedK
LLRPMTERELAAIEVRPVGPAVGNVRNNGPELLDPPVEATLF